MDTTRIPHTISQTAELMARIFRTEPKRLLTTAAVILGTGIAESLSLLALSVLLALLSADGTGSPSNTISAGLMSYANTLPKALFLFFTFFAIRSALENLRNLAVMDLQCRFVDSLRESLFGSVLMIDWETQITLQKAELRALVTLEAGRIAEGVATSLNGLTKLLLILAQLGIALALYPQVTTVALVMILPVHLLLLHQIRRARHLGQSMTESSTRMFDIVGQTLESLTIVKAYQRESVQGDLYRDVLAEVRHARLSFARRNSKLKFSLDIYVIGTICCVLLIALPAVGRPDLQVVLLVVVAMRIASNFSQLQRMGESTSQTLPAYERMAHYCDRLAQQQDQTPSSTDRIVPKTGIEFRSVCFSYPEAQGMALQHASFSIPAGRLTSLTGHSGAGKSTALALLLGLALPKQGSICVDGQPLTGATLGAWRNTIAYVPQSVLLFDDTLEANLRWVKPDASRDAMIAALERAQFFGFDSAGPVSLETRIGERGDRLSVGQKQRVALARAFLRRPDVMILDEPTSAQDHEAATRLWQTFRSLTRELTVVVVTHSLLGDRFADRVIALDTGRVRSITDKVQGTAPPGPVRSALEPGVNRR